MCNLKKDTEKEHYITLNWKSINMWRGGPSIKDIKENCFKNWLAVETLNTLGSCLNVPVIADSWFSDFEAGRGCPRGLRGSVLDQLEATMEKHLWSSLCSLLRIIRGLWVTNDLPGGGRAAHVGGTPPTARTCQEAETAATEKERQTWAQTENQGLQLNIVQDCQTGLWDSDGISRELKAKPHDTI